jgi:hypothetical protein
MDADDQQDDLIDENDETPCRERAAARLDRIADLTKSALANARIDIEVFFLVPRSGNANTILIVGTPGDPTEELWRTVTEVVSSVIRNVLGIERTRFRGLVCASTHAVSTI